MKQGQTNRLLPRECTGHSKHPLPTTQKKTLHMDNTNGQYQNQTGIFLAAKDGEALYSQQKQDLEPTAVQIKSSLLQNSGLN